MYENLESEVELNKALKEIQYNTKKFLVKNHIKNKLYNLLNEIFDEDLNIKEEILILENSLYTNRIIDHMDSDRLKLLSPKSCKI